MAVKSHQSRERRRRRIRMKISGTPERPRLNVFRSISDIYVQIIDDHSGTTLVSASSVDSGLRASLAGKSKVEQALLVGEEVAKRAKAKGISAVVFDRGGYIYTGRVKSLAEGARKGGLEF